MTTVVHVIQRNDGSEVKIVAQAFFGRGLACSIDVRVHRRESPSHTWKLTSDRPHPKWREMSVEEYCRHGRSEMLRTASIGEILKATRALQASLAM
ncbi:hypothetical protein KTD31_01005 [Burkholderia multivorans]|jgi:hypothetical protein|uniref:hypothetical protein n=1 Tax=Burkholderia multivorans TaxID=87883 RepID=UPI001C2440AF|nr:hypothetical protein [Burkholderia multivorans]MBU9199980.1 hypothetical protein [Burkholderia multivorans]MDN8078901.1 hypothetical protein [Burkholderia multivorans]